MSEAPGQNQIRNKIIMDLSAENEIPKHIFIKKLQEFIYYQNGFYHRDTKEEWITGTIILLLQNNHSDAGTVYDYYTSSHQVKGIIEKYKQTCMLDNCITLEEYQTTFNKFSRLMDIKRKKHLLINLKNGVLKINIKTGKKEVMDHHEDFYFTSILDFKYDPNAKCDLWLETLNDILPIKDSQIMYRYFMVYSLLNKFHDWETCLYLYGLGGTGKSTLIYPWQKFFRNKKVTKTKLSQMIKKHSLTNLITSDINFANESNEQIEDLSNIKMITSGEELTVEPKFKDLMDCFLDLKLVIIANELPQLKGRADQRRFIILWCSEVFDVEVTGKSDDMDRKKNLVNEVPGIFNWVINKIPDFFINLGNLKAGRASETMKIIEQLEDPALIFINEYLYEMPGHKLANTQLKKAVDMFSKTKKFDIISLIPLNKKIKKAFPNIQTYRTREERGISDLILNDNKLYELCKDWDDLKHDMVYNAGGTLDEWDDMVPSSQLFEWTKKQLTNATGIKYTDIYTYGKIQLKMKRDDCKSWLDKWIEEGVFMKSKGMVSKV